LDLRKAKFSNVIKSQHNVMIFVRCFEIVAAKKFQILIRYPLVNLNQNPKLPKMWRVKSMNEQVSKIM